MAPVVSKLVSRRLIFIIRFATIKLGELDKRIGKMETDGTRRTLETINNTQLVLHICKYLIRKHPVTMDVGNR
jgi:hypothetical protein